MSYKSELLEINDTLNPHFAKLNLLVLNDETFYQWPASKGNHHKQDTGLSSHTLEVVKICDFLASQNPKINRDILITGAIWHDYNKILCYERVWVEKDGAQVKEWQHNKYQNRIGHISGSFFEWEAHTREHNHSISEDDIEHVSHLILSHHRLPEWGSAIEPKTIEAWALHLADSASAFCGQTAKG